MGYRCELEFWSFGRLVEEPSPDGKHGQSVRAVEGALRALAYDLDALEGHGTDQRLAVLGVAREKLREIEAGMLAMGIDGPRVMGEAWHLLEAVETHAVRAGRRVDLSGAVDLAVAVVEEAMLEACPDGVWDWEWPPAGRGAFPEPFDADAWARRMEPCTPPSRDEGECSAPTASTANEARHEH